MPLSHHHAINIYIVTYTTLVASYLFPLVHQQCEHFLLSEIASLFFFEKKDFFAES